jgi:hypothetical protein
VDAPDRGQPGSSGSVVLRVAFGECREHDGG